MILEIDDKIISSEILEVKFCCDLNTYKGACCVEGNSGAPLDAEEVGILEDELDIYIPYMKAGGIEAVRKQGVMVVDCDGDFTTPLIDDAECAYSIDGNGVTLCAIEKAWFDGKTGFRKPISCHLYPIRVASFSNGTFGLNYHKWSICDCAVVQGEKLGVPLYKTLKEPIIRKFGEEFFSQLEEAEKAINNR